MGKFESTTKSRAQTKVFSGVVVSDKMDKTIVVKVERTVVHPKYRKRYVKSRKFHVHDENNQYKNGDKVDFTQCRPLSASKRWSVVNNKSQE
ncbi:MAG: 30S ribosomal protein S17 [Patescibacteria group bacterium]